MTTMNFQLKNNYYVVTDGHAFSYYNVKIFPDEGGPLLRFEKSPPIRMEGLLITDGKIYRVSADDLSRLIIRKSKEIKGLLNGTDSNSTTTETVSLDSLGNSTIPSEVEFGINQANELEISKAADLAWQNEIGSLLSAISEKEGIEDGEWEITDNP